MGARSIIEALAPERVTEGRSRSPVPWLLAAGLLAAITFSARWPGVAMYDSVSQYEQALAGTYGDWHPPIMARTWALLRQIAPGTAPFFVIQMLAWWGGLGLLAAALGRQQRHEAAAAVIAVGAAPLFLGWATVVLKDAQMACCLVAATGLAAHWRLAERPLPRWAAGAIVVLIVYATLVRANAVFATVPFALALAGWGGMARSWARAALALAAAGAVIALGPPINNGLLGAERSHVERALPLYDLAGIAHEAGLAAIPGLTPAEWTRAERTGCYSPFFWNPYGEPAQCDFVGQKIAFGDEAAGVHIMREWAGQVARHPLAYALHRARHLNANLRFWVGPGEPDALPPIDSEPNIVGLGARADASGRALVTAAGWMALSPLGWPCASLALALALLWASAGAKGGQAALGRALALSAACMSASFAVVSLASDLRYHLWSMVAAALALALLADARALARTRARIGGACVLGVVLIAGAAHLGLAPAVYVPLPAFIQPPPLIHP